MDKYYDVQRSKTDKKVSIAVTFSKDHVLQWWNNKKEQELEVAANLIWMGFKELFVESLHWSTKNCMRNKLGANE